MDIFKAIIMTVFQILGFFALFVAMFVGVCGFVWFTCEHPDVFAAIVLGVVAFLVVVALFFENLNKLKSKHDN